MNIPFPDFYQARVLVLGDVMLDRYWHGGTSRISPEAPVPVVKIGEIEERPGGAANVALNISSVGAQVELLGLTGADEAASALDAKLKEHQVTCNFQRVTSVPTITKLRVMSRNQQLIRLDFEDPYDDINALDALTQRFSNSIKGVGAVVLSDYAKGALQQVQKLIEIANQHGVPTLIDPKGSEFSRYRNASLLTPNRGEFEAVVGPCLCDKDFEEKGQALRKKFGWQALLITRSEEGMTLIQEDSVLHLPTHAIEVFDVTGAGDTVIGTMAASLAAGEQLQDCARLANMAAGIVVGKSGTATVTGSELRRVVAGATQKGTGLVTEEELLQHVADCKEHQETVVLTNGCFDLLHPGHIAYLEQARALGDRLIVAVNDDDSVRRLKGESRPVNTLYNRMAVLAGLRAVDWVVPFSEDTPARLISAIKPKVLVKGGDYKVNEVAGADFVIKEGGSVQILEFVEGCSTTAIIDRIHNQDT